jgi:plasmid stabilization system protein ParE
VSAARPKTLRWLKSAVTDLEEIVEHIADDKPQAAERFAESIFAK